MDIQRTDLKKEKQRRRIMLAAGGAIALLGAVVAVASLKPAAPTVDEASLWVDTVRRGEMVRRVRGPGTLVPRETRWIAAPVDGRVERIHVLPGTRVEPDTVLLELVNPDVVRAVEDARAAAAAARADHAALRHTLESQRLDQRAARGSARAEYVSARLQAEAEADLLEDHIVSKVQYQRSRLTADQYRIRMEIEGQRLRTFADAIEAQLAASAARVAQAESTERLRQAQFDGLKVRAGLAGVLQSVPVEEGQRVTLGSTMARVARPDELIAELRIPESQARDLLLDQRVEVDTRNGLVEGSVRRIDPAVIDGTVQVDVDLTGELPRGARPDLSVDGTVEIERLESVLYVGRPAFGQSGGNAALFKLVPGQNEAVRVPVELGRTSVNTIEIVSGLVEGDQVILSDMSRWKDYDRIEFR